MATFIYAGDRIRRNNFLDTYLPLESIGWFGALRDACLVAHIT